MTVSHVENRAWVLRIKDVKESDKGWYMCQINTDPMKNQVIFNTILKATCHKITLLSTGWVFECSR